jgi:hypothetical protein
MPPAGTGKAQAVPLQAVVHRRDPPETGGADLVPVLRLAKDGSVPGEEIPRPVVPMVIVDVRDQHHVGLF